MSNVLIGHENYIPEQNIELILQLNSAPIRDLISNANSMGKRIDARHGRKRKCVIVTSDHYWVISSLSPSVISSRLPSRCVHVGNQNYIPFDKISMILQTNSNPIRKLIKTARDTDRTIDATGNKGSPSVVLTKGGYYVVSLIESKSLSLRYDKINEFKLVK